VAIKFIRQNTIGHHVCRSAVCLLRIISWWFRKKKELFPGVADIEYSATVVKYFGCCDYIYSETHYFGICTAKDWKVYLDIVDVSSSSSLLGF
jgi:hypothetical protein